MESDHRQASTSLSERGGVQGGSDTTSNVVRVGDGIDGSGRVEDVTIFIRSDIL